MGLPATVNESMLLCCKEVARMRKTLEALFYGELQAVDMRMKQSGRISRGELRKH